MLYTARDPRFFLKSQIVNPAKNRSKLKEDGDVSKNKSRFEFYVGLHFWALTLMTSILVATGTHSDQDHIFPMKPNCPSGQTPVKVEGGWRCIEKQAITEADKHSTVVVDLEIHNKISAIN